MHWQQLGGIGECIEHVLEDYWRLVLVNCIGELYWRIVWKNCIGELHGGSYLRSSVEFHWAVWLTNIGE